MTSSMVMTLIVMRAINSENFRVRRGLRRGPRFDNRYVLDHFLFNLAGVGYEECFVRPELR